MKRKNTPDRVCKKLPKKDMVFHPQSYLYDSLKRYISAAETNVKRVLEIKSDAIKKLTKQLGECKTALKNRDDQIKVLNNEKEVFNSIIYEQVNKFDGTYQSKIDQLEKDKEEMKKQLVDQEKKIELYESQLAENKSYIGDLPLKDIEKSKLMKKCKGLKQKLKSRELDLFQKELEKRDVIKLKDATQKKLDKISEENLEANEKLKEDKKIIESMKRENEDYRKTKEGYIALIELKILDLEQKVENIKQETALRLKKQLDETNVGIKKNKALEEKLKEKDREISAMTGFKEEITKKETQIAEMIAKVDENTKLQEELKIKRQEINDIKTERMDTLEKKDTIIEEMRVAIIKGEKNIEFLEKQLDDMMKNRDNAVLELNQKIKEEESKVASFQIFKTQNEIFEEQLNLKAKEIEDLKQDINEEKAIQLSLGEEMKHAIEQNTNKFKELIRAQQESSKKLLEGKDDEIFKLNDAKVKAKENENLLLELVKSKNFLIKTLEENLAVVKEHKDNLGKEDSVKKTAETSMLKQNITSETRNIEAALAGRGTKLHML